MRRILALGGIDSIITKVAEMGILDMLCKHEDEVSRGHGAFRVLCFVRLSNMCEVVIGNSLPVIRINA